MKYLFLFLILVVALHHLGSVRFFDEYLAPGQELGMVVNVVNHDSATLKNVQVTVYGPEIGYIAQSGSFNVRHNDVYSKIYTEKLPENILPGDYLVRVSISNDKIKESTYRYITIV